MKNQFRNTVLSLVGATVCLSGCATQTSGVADTASEQALLIAGFKVKPATTAEQRNHLRTLPDNRFKMLKESGETYYLYADKKDEKLFVGNHYAYQAYINNVKNNDLRKQGAFVWEVDPSDRALNRTIVIWHGWSPFGEW
jgi:hypothetical protein